MVYGTYLRIQRLGGLYFNLKYIIATMGLIGIMYYLYKVLFMTYISALKETEADQDYFQELKETLNGTEKEVCRLYGRDLDSKMLKYVEEKYKLRYFITIVEDTIVVFTKDSNDEESPHEQISIGYFQEYFEFKTE